jgi:hypothetical protein
MKRLIVIAVVLVIVIAALASGSKHNTTTTTTNEAPPPSTTSTTSTPAAHAARLPAATIHCDQNISVNSHTTCGFADNVFRAYASTLHSSTTGGIDHDVEATSPATGQTYTVKCRGHSANSGTESIAICTGASNAVVRFPVIAAQEYTTPSKPEAQGGEETPPAAPGGSEEGGEEDSVGSSSHATDAKFCSEHECIGSFQTEGGTIVECSDGTYSHAGGISGACSHHGGEKE